MVQNEENTVVPTEVHEPTDEAFACFRLELKRPLLEGETKATPGWHLIKDSLRRVNQAIQRAVGDVVVHIRDIRIAGRTRFAVPAEKMNERLGIPLPPECYTEDDLKPIATTLNNALKNSGVSEYVYASIARKLLASEFSGARIKDLLRGDRTYPVIRNVGLMMRSRNWRLLVESRVANGKTYEDVVVEVGALKVKTGRVRLVCASLHGGHMARARNLLNNIAVLGWETHSEATGWSKGALTIRPVRRPGQLEKWEILIPYSAPRANTSKTETVLAVHRSVANMLTCVTSAGDVYHFPGRDIVALKAQMYARRKPIQKELAANPKRGRGVRSHFRALARLQGAEHRATETHIWRAAKWVQIRAEEAGASRVIIDDFASFDPDQPGPPFEPYVRTFPFAKLKLRIIDALTRRAGVTVEERPSKYISQRCPECAHVDAKSVVKVPTVRGADSEPGFFKCTKCGYRADVDKVAALNLRDVCGIKPPEAQAQTG